MKNIIAVTTLLAAGTLFSSAETIAEIDKTDSTLKAYFNFDSGRSPTAGSISWNELPTWNEGGYGVCGTTSTHPYTSGAGLRASTGFTVSFDVNNITRDGTLLSMTSAGQENMSATWRSLSITYTDGTLSAQFHGNTAGAVTKTISSESNINDWTTLTLVGSASGTTFSLDFYMNGTLIGTSSTGGANNIVQDTINKLQFGYYGNSSNSANMNVDNILIYGKALSSDEVKALTISVPEPSAFGLLAGAGALALVAARRRRQKKA